jgi:hypothetical protein
LLLIGSDIGTLVDLSISLAGSFSTTTLAATAEPLVRAKTAVHEKFDAIVISLDGLEDIHGVELPSDPRIVFLADELDAFTSNQIRATGRLVVDAREPPILITAALLALGSPTPGATGAKSP